MPPLPIATARILLTAALAHATITYGGTLIVLRSFSGCTPYQPKPRTPLQILPRRLT